MREAIKEERNYNPFELAVSVLDNTVDMQEHRLLLHWHQYIEFIYVLEGEGVLTIDLKDYKVVKGNLIVVSPSSLHGGTGADTNPLICKVILADVEMLMGNLKDKITKRYLSPMLNQTIKIIPIIESGTPLYRETAILFDQVLEKWNKQDDGYELYIKGYLTQMLAALFEAKHYRESAGRSTIKEIEQMKRLIRFIEEHYSEPLSVELLAQFTGYNRYYFMHFFKMHTGYTVTQYLNLKRTEYAARMLAEQDWSISEISERTGYQDVSYFIRVFAKRYGITPLVYRKRIRSEIEETLFACPQEAVHETPVFLR